MNGICKNCEKTFEYFESQKNGIYCSNRCQADYKLKPRFTENTRWNYAMRNYIIRQRGNKCESCEIIEWNNQPLSFQVDHINGNRKDNRFENLKVLCPNCHSQTDTFGSKNVSERGKEQMKDSANKNRTFSSVG